MRFVPLQGRRHDTIGVPPLIEGVAFGALLGDKTFDIDWLRADLDACDAAAVIPRKAGRKTLVACGRAMYRWRHLIENTFAKLKEFRAVATRYDKAEGNSRANIKVAVTIIASRWTSIDPRPAAAWVGAGACRNSGPITNSVRNPCARQAARMTCSTF